MEEVDVWDLIGSTMGEEVQGSGQVQGKGDSQGCVQQQQQQLHLNKWDQVVQNLKLCDQQLSKLQQLRSNCMDQFEQLINQRVELSKQAVMSLLPQDEQYAKKQKQNLTCFFEKECHKSQINDILAKLKSNIRQEQKVISELDQVVFSEVLSPLQGAWFIVDCYPQHCDCMSLLNAVHRKC
eukprot:TRINITY_DN12153_c0_g1_i1.p1 TRINITY_DN12153_c0_g1~~TRINITY_DN12153_c0_g1_i1.p1  ORF type:complete len:181 (-),score=20.01 TRINITY_DN12153_c0_g1_i1:129-671(-)